MRHSFLLTSLFVVLITSPLWGQTPPRGTSRSAQPIRRPPTARVVAPVIADEDYLEEEYIEEETEEVLEAPPPRRVSSSARGGQPNARQVSHPAHHAHHAPIMEEGVAYEEGGCNSCSSGFCQSPYDGILGPGWGRNGCRGPWFADFEFLNWWGKGMSTPPLISVITNANANPPTSQVIYPTSDFFTETRPGGRVRLGKWADCTEKLGIYGEFFYLNDASSSFIAQSDANGNPEYGRPFISTDGTRLIEDVSILGELEGSVRVDAISRFSGAGIWLRRNLGCEDISGCDPCGDACGGMAIGSRRVDFILGYRYLRLDERLNVHESLTSLLPAPDQGHFEIDDTFVTRNDFHGADVGFQWDNYRGRWYMGLLTKVAIGSVHEHVRISGQTVTTNANNAADNGTRQGGLLAQVTNIGSYSRNEFAIVPELGANLGYQLTDHWRLQVGYTLIYWSRVVRPGDQIDNVINPTVIPQNNAVFAGAARPEFNFNVSDYWVQGLNVGLHLDF